MKKSSLYTIIFLDWKKNNNNTIRTILGIHLQPLLANCKLILAHYICYFSFPSNHWALSPSTTLFILSYLFCNNLWDLILSEMLTKPLENEKVLIHLQQVDMHLSTSTIWMNLSIVDKQMSEFLLHVC